MNNIYMLDAYIIAYGLFRHVILEPGRFTFVPTSAPVDLAPLRYCETRLPANFCMCGQLMLMEEG